jgi:ATPase subunit of ABC transporter with duplicated ATPase domains
VILAENISKSFGDRLLFENLNFTLPPNGIVGIIGPNGAGKTTLFRMIMGLETPDSGTFTVGETVKLGYADQNHEAIDKEKSVYQVLSGGTDEVMVGGRSINARAYVSRFNFGGADQEKKCGVLSGGELNTLRALEEGLESFAGCAVVISHDRWFLDRIATHILAFEGNSQVYFFEGSYSEYEENKKKRLGDITPHRIRYKKLG